MRKVAAIEERNRQQVYRMLNELSVRIPSDDSDVVVFDLYIQEYERMVNRMFSANVFFKGMDHACRVYKHIVKVEYRRFCRLIIQKIEDISLRERVLLNIRKTRNRLLKVAPSISREELGFEIFYGTTGGFRKKYRTDRKAIQQMHEGLKQTSAIPLYPIYYWCMKFIRFFSYLKKHLLWELRLFVRQ